MIALALACSPSVLLADEPTTALDVTVQIQILLLLRQLQQELGMAIVFVTHDVGAAAEISDRIAVMYAGRFVETATAREIMRAAAPSLHAGAARLHRAWRAARPRAGDDSRRTAQSCASAARLRVRPALPPRGRSLHARRGAGDRVAHRRDGALRARRARSSPGGVRMKPSVSETEFDVMVKQTGLPLSAEQKTTLYDAYWMLEAMIALVNTPMPLESRARAHVHPGGAMMDRLLTIAEARG